MANCEPKRGASNFVQRPKQPVYLVGGVVMGEAEPQQTAVSFEAESFRQLQGVEVPVPGIDLALCQMPGKLLRCAVLRGDRHGRGPFGEAAEVRDAPDVEAGAFGQS